jgi:hypothetical protein
MMINLPLPGRCLALTGSFETGKLPPDCFSALAGDFDGQGISFGALQWNIGQGTLQPLFRQMFEKYEILIQSIFGEQVDTLRTLADAPLSSQLAFCRSIQVKNHIIEPWQSMLKALGGTPQCWDVQTNLADKTYQTAVRLCNQLGLSSERAVALLFDVITQNGSIGSSAKKQILAEHAGSEVARMCSIAAHVANAANPKYRDDVHARKLLIATGQGTVHGIHYDLTRTFSLTLNPYWETTVAA